jgi:hypothetical protein
MDVREEFPEHDRAVRDWFAARGWPISETFACFQPHIYAWRHSGSPDRHTLYVTREVLRRNDARTLPNLLDERAAETALRELPDGEAILCYNHRLLVVRYFEPVDE